MYIGNIVMLHQSMQENEIMKIGFTSGKSINYILKSDIVEKIAGANIRITRTNSNGRIVTIIDPAEVECMCIITGDL